jgi:hypothetical protein
MKFGGRRSLPDEIMASGFEGDAMSEARDIITEFGSVRYEFQDC